DPHYARYALDPSYAKFVDKYSRGGGHTVARLGPGFAYTRPKLAAGGNVTGTGNDVLPEYDETPRNGPDNDPGSGYQTARGSNDYSWGKVSPRFQNNGAEIEPHGHGETTRRNGQGEDYLSQGSGAPKIHAEHSGSGLVLNIHLSDVGPHAITLGDNG